MLLLYPCSYSKFLYTKTKNNNNKKKQKKTACRNYKNFIINILLRWEVFIELWHCCCKVLSSFREHVKDFFCCLVVQPGRVIGLFSACPLLYLSDQVRLKLMFPQLPTLAYWTRLCKWIANHKGRNITVAFKLKSFLPWTFVAENVNPLSEILTIYIYLLSASQLQKPKYVKVCQLWITMVVYQCTSLNVVPFSQSADSPACCN